MNTIIKELKEIEEKILFLKVFGTKKVIGKTVRIISKYNGQPFGRSKKPLTGKTGIIEQVSYGDGFGICVKLKNHRVYLNIDEVEFLD